MFRHTLIVLFAVLGLLPREAKAEEFIKSFDAAIQVEPSGALNVTETITVHATGDKIRHGIYRDFPISWTEGDARGFKIVTVERDGRQDDWSQESISGGTRIYLGTQSQTVSPGDHTYRIRYHTGNQIRFHDTYDNLVWNVTGNGWLFPINSATATVRLPDNAKPKDATVYTGPVGSGAKDATAQVSNDAASFAMKRSLAIGEGLTIDIKIAKGVILPPAPVQTPYFGPWDGRTAVVGGGVLAIALLVLFAYWFLYGRDPSKGTAPLRWTVPEGLSPGLIGYIKDSGFPDSGRTAFSASLVDLAVHGYLKIKSTSDAAYIIRTEKNARDDLPRDQLTILQYINSTDTYNEISKDNRNFTILILNQYTKSINYFNEGIFFVKNRTLLASGAALLLFSILLSSTLAVKSPLLPFSFLILLPISAFIPGLALIFLFLFSRFLRLNRYTINKIHTYYLFLFAISTTFIMFLLSSHGGNPETTTELSLIVLFVPIASIPLFLMGRATNRGRAIKDQIEGLRKYLTLSTHRRAAMGECPVMSRAHFESLLPYAIVLGVEESWLRAFEEWQGVAANTLDYNPKWWMDASFTAEKRGFGGALYRVISTSAPSSSFGSGFSGSGGGGGGGGW